jgi:glycosyltransferase involved in cell wall biosynthesis
MTIRINKNMQVKKSKQKFRVGIDLAPASRMKISPGTAVHVLHQVTALMKMDVPWEWVPVAESPENPLLDITSRWDPSILAGKSVWRRATFPLAAEWKRRGCNLGFATAFFVPWMGIPVVANFFDAGMFTEHYANTWKSGGRGWSFRLIKTLGSYAVRRSQKLFTDSEYWKKILLQRLPPGSEKVVVAPCGVKPPSPCVEKTPDWALTLLKPYFLYVGVFSDNKNQCGLLEAWKRLQAAHPDFPSLVLIGPHAADYYSARIAPLVASMPRPQEIVIPGVVSNDDLAWAYQHTLGYFQPSYMEGFGIPIIEAMSYGVPVACSDSTSLPETAGGASLLFAPDDPETICRAAESLWRDASLRAKLSQQGRERSAIFTWENHARIVAEGIESVLFG